MTDVSYVVASVGLTWLMVLSASLLRAKAWTPAGLGVAFGNRDNVPEAPPVAGRAERAGKNMVENMVLFVAVFAAARAANAPREAVTLGASIFFWARVAYWAVYLAGIPYLRTLLWFVSLAGIALLGNAAVRA